MIRGVEIYPKTPRIPIGGDKIYLTEKLDGSNLVFFKKEGQLYIAQRKNIFTLSELEEVKDIVYKGLYQWLKDYGSILQENLHEGSAICGEWLGMGTLKYTVDEFDKRWYMFAKGNIGEDYKLTNMKYNHSLFVYPFIDQNIPAFIGIVPEVAELNVLPNKDYLDKIYDKYLDKVKRPVEGFVINYNDNISKYVRMKSGKLVDYSDNDHKNS